jgi:hypothetical protein
MARKFVSPGVFTTEIDQSFLAQGVASIGAVVVGRTRKGPAFVPTVVDNFTRFGDKFGDVDPTLQTPYAAKNYLKNSTVLTVVRVLGTRDGQAGVSNGWQHNAAALVDGAGKMWAEVHYPTSVTSVVVSGTGASFVLRFMSGATEKFASTCSFAPANSDYVGKVLNTDPTQVGTYSHYLYKNTEWAQTGTIQGVVTASLSGGHGTAGLDMDYAGAMTPWVVSQHFANQVYNLFRFVSIAHGETANSDFKVTVTNLRASSNTNVTKHGTFDVVIRDFNDTDDRPVVIESFPACDLDPDSINYLPRRIGDMYESWNSSTRKFSSNGTFKNKSKFVRVVMAENVNSPDEALPWGFYGYAENGPNQASLVDLPYVANNLSVAGNVETEHMWGVDFAKKGISHRLKALLNNAVQFQGSLFSLSFVSTGSLVGGYRQLNYTQGTQNPAWPAVPGTASVNGFSLALAGGFDGWDVTKKDPTDITDAASATDYAVVSLKAGVDAIGNPDQFDLNLLTVPGCIANKVTDHARKVCNDRADCMFIMDITGSTVADAVNKLNDRGIDDNYTATYYPDLKLNDRTNNKILSVKPSVAVLGAYAFNDRVGQPFFAPAGLNRGGLGQFDITDVADRLTFEDRNTLYENRINPIATFPNEGIVVFGQKTRQAKPSALDRVNVRRLLIFAKKTVASAAKYLLFEPNNTNTWQRFLNTVNPILDKVKMDQGIERFKVVMDKTVNTPDLIDRNVMTGKIFLQPTRSAEFIDLGFVITSSGVEFEE